MATAARLRFGGGNCCCCYDMLAYIIPAGQPGGWRKVFIPSDYRESNIVDWHLHPVARGVFGVADYRNKLLFTLFRQGTAPFRIEQYSYETLKYERDVADFGVLFPSLPSNPEIGGICCDYNRHRILFAVRTTSDGSSGDPNNPWRTIFDFYSIDYSGQNLYLLGSHEQASEGSGSPAGIGGLCFDPRTDLMYWSVRADIRYAPFVDVNTFTYIRRMDGVAGGGWTTIYSNEPTDNSAQAAAIQGIAVVSARAQLVFLLAYTQAAGNSYRIVNVCNTDGTNVVEILRRTFAAPYVDQRVRYSTKEDRVYIESVNPFAGNRREVWRMKPDGSGLEIVWHTNQYSRSVTGDIPASGTPIATVFGCQREYTGTAYTGATQSLV